MLCGGIHMQKVGSMHCEVILWRPVNLCCGADLAWGIVLSSFFSVADGDVATRRGGSVSDSFLCAFLAQRLSFYSVNFCNILVCTKNCEKINISSFLIIFSFGIIFGMFKVKPDQLYFSFML